MGAAKLTFANMTDKIGQHLGTSQWFVVDQNKVNMFAECTGDQQWIHIDVERAKKESPFGGPVAHGYLTLSLLAGLSSDMDIRPAGIAAIINYGLDKVRFLNPVAVGSRVRLQTKLVSFDRKENGHYLMKTENTIEIENVDKPALISENLALLVPGPDAELEA